MNGDMLLAEFERIADSPKALQLLRPFVIELALRGELGTSDASDTAATFDQIALGMEALLQSLSQVPLEARNNSAKSHESNRAAGLVRSGPG